MIGYVQKDHGKPGYRFKSNGISDEDLERGREGYPDLSADMGEGKITITRRKFWDMVVARNWFSLGKNH